MREGRSSGQSVRMDHAVATSRTAQTLPCERLNPVISAAMLGSVIRNLFIRLVYCGVRQRPLAEHVSQHDLSAEC